MSMLEVKDLHFGYNAKEILKGVDFAVEEGECFLIFGPNGCGKTTLLDTILGVTHADAGTVILNGKEMMKIPPVDKAKEVAYVPQKSNRTFQYTCLQMVLMGRTAYSGLFSSPGKEDIAIAEATLRSVGMQDYAERPYTKLSGGEAQLVKIARAIAQGTNLIAFDEPTSHLDFRHELNVIQYIAKIVKEKKISIVMATHFPNHAFYLESMGLKTRVAMMENGVFGAVGTPSEVLNAENMERIFKVKIKTFEDDSYEIPRKYIVPVEFVNGGSWNESDR